MLNVDLRKYMLRWLNGRGYMAAAPVLLPEYKNVIDTKQRIYTSTWSERHMAYACGLGTFSLNEGLITTKGIAHRLGSVVTNAGLPQTPRHYKGHMDYCLFSRGCRACIKRCPAKAISRLGHNKDLCYKMNYLGEGAAARIRELGFQETGCGLCQVGVPCEDRIPSNISISREDVKN